jgi:ankyrin repeat protein
VDLFDSVHGTALHAAASKGEAGMVKLLLEYHADVSTGFFLLPLAVLTKSLFVKAVRLCSTHLRLSHIGILNGKIVVYPLWYLCFTSYTHVQHFIYYM